uniref:peptidoglycan-binding protein n=1 Tax=Streptomyces sp. NRRL F-525 TaxID=1463861 RepID=UPI000527337C
SKDTAPEAAATITATPDADDTAARYEPYPGPTFFHGGRHSDIITAMARRLEAEGHGDGRYLGPDWTNAHRDAFARFQQTLRPKGAGDVTGIPDETAWERLLVPRVSPLPRES